MFRDFEKQAREAIIHALRESGYRVPESLELLVPSNRSLGDLSSPIALRLAREARKPPAAIAEELANSISRTQLGEFVGTVTAHPNGYLNFRLRWDVFALATVSVARSPPPFVRDAGQPQRISVEHTNVNPNKALHIGHARNLVLGDSLARILRRLGNSVQVLNYIDDSGAQVADVIVGFRFLNMPDQSPSDMKFDTYSGDKVYILVNKAYGENPELKEKQRLVLQEIEKGTGELAEYAHRIVMRILADQLKTCWRLGASYDLLNWESHILKTGMWERVFEQMKRDGVAVYETEGENAGCWVIKDDELGGDKVLVRSDGTVVYVAKDIPYAAWKVGLIPDPFRYEIYSREQPTGRNLWTTSTSQGEDDHPPFGGAQLAISIIDVRQSRLQAIVSRVLARMKGEEHGAYVHRGYEVVALSKRSAEALGIATEKDFIHMQGRKGLYINADAVLDALKRRALEEVTRRNPSQPTGDSMDVAEKIAIAAFRFELVKQDPDKVIAFDLESSLELQGETGPYLLYSYARARRILEKAGTAPRITISSAGRMTHPKEVELINLIAVLDKVIIEAREYLNPKEIARYAYRLCSVFNEFYEAVPVNSAEDELKAARLALVDAFSVTLALSLDLIGVPTSDRI